MRERCLMCLRWHEPGDHQPKSIPVTLTGQVPVSGNRDDDEDA